MTRLEEMGAAAKQAARKLAVAGNQKDTALEAIAAALEAHTEEILGCKPGRPFRGGTEWYVPFADGPAGAE